VPVGNGRNRNSSVEELMKPSGGGGREPHRSTDKMEDRKTWYSTQVVFTVLR